MSTLFETLAPLSVSFSRAAELTSMSKNTLRRMAKSGRLRTIKLGQRRVVPYQALKELVSIDTSESTSASSAAPVREKFNRLFTISLALKVCFTIFSMIALRGSLSGICFASI